MKKYFLPLLALSIFSALNAGAQAGYLPGNWVEVNRATPKGHRIPFSDTLKLNFMIGNEYTRFRNTGFIYKGSYTVTGNKLDLGSMVFIIDKADASFLTLHDAQGIYQFIHYTPAGTQVASNQLPISRSPDATPAGAPPANLSALTGKWEVYKRTATSHPDHIDYTQQLQSIDIKPGKNDTLGLVYPSSNNLVAAWAVTGYNNGVIQFRGANIRQLKVISFDGRELIAESDGVTYFFRQFGNR